tara:strand:- start:361 stop:636 length:276 start_codon:yes stop_codon:yes gene_type:complete
MNRFFKNKIFEKLFYWLSAISILIAVPLLTFFFLKLGTVIYPLGLIIKTGIYIFCGGVTIIGFIAIILFFYESTILKLTKKFKFKRFLDKE